MKLTLNLPIKCWWLSAWRLGCNEVFDLASSNWHRILVWLTSEVCDLDVLLWASLQNNLPGIRVSFTRFTGNIHMSALSTLRWYVWFHGVRNIKNFDKKQAIINMKKWFQSQGNILWWRCIGGWDVHLRYTPVISCCCSIYSNNEKLTVGLFSIKMRFYKNSNSHYNNKMHTFQGYPGYFREPQWFSMGLSEISRVTLQVWRWCWYRNSCYTIRYNTIQ